MIDGTVEEALDLPRVQVDAEQAVGSGGGEHVGDQLGGDGFAPCGLSILSAVAIEGGNDGDPLGGGSVSCVDHHEVLDQRVVDGSVFP